MKTTKQEKRKYVKPTSRTIELHSRTMILTGSGNGIQSMRKGYGTASVNDGTEQEWE